MKTALRILGIIAACVGIIFAVNMIHTAQTTTVPEKHVYVSSSSSAYYKDWWENTGAEYLGGDAYNYIVEASLKAGYYSATVTSKTIRETGGMILLFLSVFFLLFSGWSLQNCLSAARLEKAPKTKDPDYQKLILRHLQRIEENTRQPVETPDEAPSGERHFMDL